MFILSRRLAFLDEEAGGPRRAGGAGAPAGGAPDGPRATQRQQFLVRRLIGGRRRRRLPDPARDRVPRLPGGALGSRACGTTRSDVGTIMQESEQRGEEFFELLEQPERRPSSSSSSRPDPSGCDALAEPARPRREPRRPGPDGRCAERRHPDPEAAANALEVIAEQLGAATADAETADAIAPITQADGVALRERRALDAARRRRRSRASSKRRAWTHRSCRRATSCLRRRDRVPRPDRDGRRS